MARSTEKTAAGAVTSATLYRNKIERDGIAAVIRINSTSRPRQTGPMCSSRVPILNRFSAFPCTTGPPEDGPDKPVFQSLLASPSLPPVSQHHEQKAPVHMLETSRQLMRFSFPGTLELCYKYYKYVKYLYRHLSCRIVRFSSRASPRKSHYPPGVMDPIARKAKISTSCKKWMNHAQKSPRVSSIDFPKIHPKNAARITPTMPYGTP